MKHRLTLGGLLLVLTAILLHQQLVPKPSASQRAIVEAARTCLGDRYDSRAYPGGPPPEGRGACTDVVFYALLPILDLQKELNGDVALHPGIYKVKPNPDLDYRWCPTQIKWFRRHWQTLPETDSITAWNFHPGDVVYFDDGNGVPGHVGVVSDKIAWDGKPLLIHNPGPICVEENALDSNRIVGHFRMARP
jgi:uncharacterized protein